MTRETLPIEGVLDEIRDALRRAPVTLLQAPPGSGKSTGVPLDLLSEPWMGGSTIVLLQPRRIATRAVASRLAERSGTTLGGLVGYQMRFESSLSAETKIEVITEGLLARRLQRDPALDGVGLVILDEFHERSIHVDLALAMLLDVQGTIRPELRVLIMSATLDVPSLRAILPDAPLVIGDAPSYPVTVEYRDTDRESEVRPRAGSLARGAAAAVRSILPESEGDILVFLPGTREIRDTADLLASVESAAVVTLFGEMPFEDQRRVMSGDPAGARRIILSTPIAETSVTLPGVRTVVDTGYVKTPRYDAGSGMDGLVLERISVESADQRTGRAGRVAPGRCLRLWSAHVQGTLRSSRTPEILGVDLLPLALELAAWGSIDGRALRWVTPPPVAQLSEARGMLRRLGAIDESAQLTALGRELVCLGTHPRFGVMTLRADARERRSLACDLIALLEERDPVRREDESGVDITTRLIALERLRKTGRKTPSVFRRIDETSRLWCRRIGVPHGSYDVHHAEVSGSIGALLASAYPDRIAKRRGSTNDHRTTGNRGMGARYLLANGVGARLREHDPLEKEEFLVVVRLGGGQSEGNIQLAAPLSLDEIERSFADLITVRDEVEWESRFDAVRAERVRLFGELPLTRVALESPPYDAVIRAWCRAFEERGMELLQWSPEAKTLQRRCDTVRRWVDPAFPDLSDEALLSSLDSWLGTALVPCRRIGDLARIDLMGSLRGLLSWEELQKLDRVAPMGIDGPDGAFRRIDYGAGERPVLAATVQELLGWIDTPKIGGTGRDASTLPLQLHILSPARRPIQVTDDLRGFWERTYHSVRKELRGRYPKHDWPDDPLTSGPRRRRRAVQ